jgi:hypothetical protein
MSTTCPHRGRSVLSTLALDLRFRFRLLRKDVEPRDRVISGAIIIVLALTGAVATSCRRAVPRASTRRWRSGGSIRGAGKTLGAAAPVERTNCNIPAEPEPKAMKKTIISVLAVAAMVLTTAALSAQQQPAESPVLDAASRARAVESVASIVELNYPWPDTARMIAAHMRGRHASRAYDTIPTLADLARALTRDLRAINGDLHLMVVGGSSGASGMMALRPEGRPTGVDRVEHLDDNVGYLKFSLLPPSYAFDAVAHALRTLDGTDAMILDLRAVPGGTVQMTDFLVSHFMPPEVRVLSAFSPATGETTHRHTLDEVPGPRRLDVPLYVLVDGRSGSAAELVPFILQNFGRATIVGERTAGAGRSASVFPAELGLTVSVSTLHL